MSTGSNNFAANASWSAEITGAITVEVWGGGGSGGTYGKTSGAHGAGGAGGGAYSRSTVSVVSGTSYTVVVGTGGAAGGNNSNGANGTYSSFNNNEVWATGGQGGNRGGAAGAGGATTGNGTVKWAGGNGAANAAAVGGGGGAGADSNAKGTDASGAAGGVRALDGGNGGNGGASNTSGANGSAPGGGGGGAGANAGTTVKVGGNGAIGSVRLTWYFIGPIYDVLGISEDVVGELISPVSDIDKEIWDTVNVSEDITKQKIKGLNDFSGDSNCCALYRFESGALTTDSKGTNTLTNVNTVTENTTDEMEGSCCAKFEKTTSERFIRANADLSSDFPLKSGTSNTTFSITAWINLESTPASGLLSMIASKYSSATKSFWLGIDDARKVKLCIGGPTEPEEDILGPHDTALSLATPYHITASYDNATKAYAIRIRDIDGGVVGTDKTGTSTQNIVVGTEEFAIGAVWWTSYLHFFDGLIDELVVFNDIITEAEATEIAQGIYNKTSPRTADINDTINISEDLTLRSLGRVEVIDNARISEDLTLKSLGRVEVIDTAKVSEDLALNSLGRIEVTDTVRISEELALTSLSWVSVYDIATLAEDVTGSVVTPSLVYLEKEVTDQVNVSEDLTLKSLGRIDILDNVKVSEDLTLRSLGRIDVVDTIRVSEDLTLKSLGRAEVIDQVNVSEYVESLFKQINADIYDGVTVGESLGLGSLSYLEIYDDVFVSEDVTAGEFANILNADIYDIVSLSEDVETTHLPLFAELTDMIVCTESISIQPDKLVCLVVDYMGVGEPVSDIIILDNGQLAVRASGNFFIRL